MSQFDAAAGRWILQLYREHETICRRHGIELPRPLIELSDDRTRWGSFHPEQRTIRISRRLIANHSWAVTIEVLKHEMAHQLVDLQGGGHEPPHGPLFRKAAERLGLPPEFAAAGGDLPRMTAGGDAGAERLRQRVAKLLSLSSSANENEARAAMAKAGELIMRYNLEQAADPAGYCYQVVELKRKRVEGWQRQICRILMDYYSVDVVLAAQFSAADCCEYRTVELFGTPAAVANAAHVFSFLSERLATFWKMQRTGRRHGAGARNSYWRGVLDGFSASLAETVETRKTAINSAGGPLLPVPAGHDSRLAAFVRRRHPQLRLSGGRTVAFQPGMYACGKREGAALFIRRPVEASGVRMIE